MAETSTSETNTLGLSTPHPAVPLTIEGAWCLHQMFRWRVREWRAAGETVRRELLDQLGASLSEWESPTDQARPNQSAAYSMLGHKGDLLLLHFRDSATDLHAAERTLASLPIFDYLELTHSYVSVVELGLYDSSGKAYTQLTEAGVIPHSSEWDHGIQEILDRQSTAMSPRLYPAIPDARFICFYPMDRKRGEDRNWYQVPMAERQRMMHEHGLIGRRYAHCVRQIITGSIGFDDWEWGVDLFADDPLVFKKLIYEMRFDEVSAVYALFGTFYLAERVRAAALSSYLL